MDEDSIEFKEIADEKYFLEIEDIQRDAWKVADLALVPQRMFKATQRSGAVIIGAFEDDQLLGYCWGWVGRTEKHGVFIYSHHNAVRKKYQNRGLGNRLKIEQRNWALKNDFSLINWTFDPLQSKNCYINLHKLGVICNTYYLNYWGEMNDAENIGMQTDRFYCNWYLKTNHVQRRLNHLFPDYSELLLQDNNHAIFTEKKNDLLQIKETCLDIDSDIIFVQIPDNLNELRQKSKQLIVDWREKTRSVFLAYMKKGYIDVDFSITRTKNDLYCYHVLKKNYNID